MHIHERRSQCNKAFGKNVIILRKKISCEESIKQFTDRMACNCKKQKSARSRKKNVKAHSLRAQTLLLGLVAPCGGVDNKVPQLHVTYSEP